MSRSAREPQPGEVYRDLDQREVNRLLRVLYIEGFHAVCENFHGTRKTRIRLDRLAKRFERQR